MKRSGKSVVNHPSHYQSESGIEVVDVIEAFAHDDGHVAHALTYILRRNKKDGYNTNLMKAIWWLIRAVMFNGGHPELKDLLKPSAMKALKFENPNPR